ncbi:hypothetical protein FI667_g11174, partial [Globisporangium splendens]
MSTWDGRCFHCRRLMSSCVCYELRASSSQNLNPNGHTGGDMSPTQAQSGKRHLFGFLKERHPVRINPLVPPHADAERQARESSAHRRRESNVSGSITRSTTRSSHQPRRTHPPPSTASSSMPSTSTSGIFRPDSSIHRHSSPVPPRPTTAAAPMPSSRSDPASIRAHQAAHASSHRPPRPRYDEPQYYAPGSGYVVNAGSESEDDTDYSMVFEL